MARPKVLTPLEVREYVFDYTPVNYLLDGQEFSDTFILLCIDLAISAFNEIPPKGSVDIYTFPGKGLLMMGTLWKMYEGKKAHLARNTMAYNDGGISLPIEERFELYNSMAMSYANQFSEAAKAVKINENMEAGWGFLSSEEAVFPNW